MKRNNVGKSKSFQMRRNHSSSSSNSSRQQQPRLRERSIDRSRIITSYDALGLGSNHKHAAFQHAHSFSSSSQRQQQQQPDLHLSDDSESDCDINIKITQKQKGNDVVSCENNRYEDWSQLASSYMGLPNLMFFSSSSSSAPASLTTTTTTPTNNFQTPTRTRSKFKPSYLLQRRKEGLVQHQPQQGVVGVGVSPFPEHSSRKNSIPVLLFLMAACYLLMSLAKTTDTTTTTTTTNAATSSWTLLQQPSSSTTTTYYYLNLKEERPIQMVTKMLTMNAYAFQLQQNQQLQSSAAAATFVGVCGYPTYQLESQRQAQQILVQMGLQDILKFDVCPPIEAILHRDPNYILLEEQDIPTSTTVMGGQVGGSSSSLLSNPVWQATIASQTKATTRDPTELWQQVLTTTTTITDKSDTAASEAVSSESVPRRQLRGLEKGPPQ